MGEGAGHGAHAGSEQLPLMSGYGPWVASGPYCLRMAAPHWLCTRLEGRLILASCLRALSPSPHRLLPSPLACRHASLLMHWCSGLLPVVIAGTWSCEVATAGANALDVLRRCYPLRLYIVLCGDVSMKNLPEGLAWWLGARFSDRLPH